MSVKIGTAAAEQNVNNQEDRTVIRRNTQGACETEWILNLALLSIHNTAGQTTVIKVFLQIPTYHPKKMLFWQLLK